MKTPEEIEQLADKFATSIYGFRNENHNSYLECKRNCIEFYTQCQEDMKQKLEQFYNHGKWAIIEHGHGDTFEDYYNRIFKQH